MGYRVSSSKEIRTETVSTLPCVHEERITEQVRPTIALLNHMDDWHPEVLRQHEINPDDYKAGLVFRSAVESIRGSFIASAMTGREGMVGDVLENLRARGLIANYGHSGPRNRYDFEISLTPDYFAALEVKGGEGNSINISERPIWAREFVVWSHLDGAIVNQPAHGAHSIINRLANELTRRKKLVDALFFKDVLCGTTGRPCPKYAGQERQIGLATAPDIFLFPQRVPSPEEPRPPVHTLNSLKLPQLVLDLFDVEPTNYEQHIWYVAVELDPAGEGRFRRVVTVTHNGTVVDTSMSRPWRAVEE